MPAFTTLDGTVADLAAGWYLCDSALTYPTGITTTDANGDINLVLGPDCDLRATGDGAGSAAVQVGDTVALTIYNQNPADEGEGRLTATGLAGGAGIGEDGGGFFPGAITINGGTVTATGATGAAIGSGEEGFNGTVAVNRGVVEATATLGAAIGSGHKGGSSTVYINGGTVIARNASDGAGIGDGAGGRFTHVYIDGGRVIAESVDGSGIGGGAQAGGRVLISGGTVTATGIDGAGVGAGSNSAGDVVKVSGGRVTATSTGAGAGIGGGWSGASGSVEITGGEVTATAAGGAGVGGGSSGRAEQIVITGGEVAATSNDGGAGIGGGTGAGSREVLVYGDASVTATGGGEGGAGIGSGRSASDAPGDITVATSGDILVTAGTAAAPIGAGASSTGDATEWLVRTSTAEGSILPVDMPGLPGDQLPAGMTQGTFSVPADGAQQFEGTGIGTLVLDGDPLGTLSHTFTSANADHELTAGPWRTISEVDVALDAPATAAQLDPDAESADPAGYAVDSVAWSPADDTAAPGEVYTATVVVSATDADSSSFAADVVGTVNGQPAETTPNADGTLTLEYAFPETAKAMPTLSLGVAPASGEATEGDDVVLTATLAGSYPDAAGRQIVFTITASSGAGAAEFSALTGDDGVAAHTMAGVPEGEYAFEARYLGDDANEAAAADPISAYVVAADPDATDAADADATDTGADASDADVDSTDADVDSTDAADAGADDATDDTDGAADADQSSTDEASSEGSDAEDLAVTGGAPATGIAIASMLLLIAGAVLVSRRGARRSG